MHFHIPVLPKPYALCMLEAAACFTGSMHMRDLTSNLIARFEQVCACACSREITLVNKKTEGALGSGRKVGGPSPSCSL